MSDNINIVKNSLRWIAVLPISIAGSIVGCLILIALILFGDLLSGDLWLYMHHPEVFPISHFFTSFLVSAALGCIFCLFRYGDGPGLQKSCGVYALWVLSNCMRILTNNHFAFYWLCRVMEICRKFDNLHNLFGSYCFQCRR